MQRFDCDVLQDRLKNENHYISTTRVTVATKLGTWVTYGGLLPKNRSRGKLKLLYLLSHGAAKLGWMGTKLEGLLAIKLHDALIT